MEMGRTADDLPDENDFRANLFAITSVLLPLFVSMDFLYLEFGNFVQKRASALSGPTYRA